MAKLSKSQQNSMMLDPNRAKISKNMSYLPGAPGSTGENNNPMNVMDFGKQSASMSGVSQHPYGDTGNVYPQMGADAINPMVVPNSGLQQSFPVAGRGQNQMPYGMQPQPDVGNMSPIPDGMESSRLMSEIPKGLPSGPMGYMGLPATPGSVPPNMPGTSGPPLMPSNPSGMVPGSTPQKINQKKKGGKK